jgi:anti-anti-sigma factor
VSDLARVVVEDPGDPCLVRIDGEIDISNAADVSEIIGASVPNAARTIVLDLTGLSYVDSAGVQLLFTLAERMRGRRQVLRIVVPQEAPIRSVLEFAGLATVVPLEDRMDGRSDP